MRRIAAIISTRDEVMLNLRMLASGCMLLAAIPGARMATAADNGTWDGKIVQYGTMHEAIGQQQHEGRVPSGKLRELGRVR